MERNKIFLLAAICVFSLLVIMVKSQENNRFEGSIRTFEDWDKKNSFPQNAVLFVGSSSIAGWQTHECFGELLVINRGLGGSQISDINYSIDRIVLPYKPKVIVFYAGDNDIAGGKSVKQVVNDYTKFVGIVHKELPETRIIFMSMKYSNSNWSKVDIMKEANGLIEEYSKKDPRLIYFDAAKPLLGTDGKPNDALFKSDRHHPNEKGYELWAKLLKPVIQKALDK